MRVEKWEMDPGAEMNSTSYESFYLEFPASLGVSRGIFMK
jgi:hypothetical protein